MNFDKTMSFKAPKDETFDAQSILKEVYEALQEKGYNPINQIVGYLISGDPGYISNFKESREKMLEFDRSEIMAIILEEYLSKKWDH